jgi:hypothetical protein
MMLELLERPLPASWEEQRDYLGAGEPARRVGPLPVPTVALPRSHITEGVSGGLPIAAPMARTQSPVSVSAARCGLRLVLLDSGTLQPPAMLKRLMLPSHRRNRLALPGSRARGWDALGVTEFKRLAAVWPEVCDVL